MRRETCHCCRRQAGAWTLALASLGLAACVLSLSGCEAMGAMAAPFDNRVVKAEFTLQPRTTAVIVDDPRSADMLRLFINQIAVSTAYFLETNAALPPKSVVAPEKLTLLREDLGDRYGSIAIDDLGRRLGAEQVLYVELAEMALTTQPGMIEPRALLRIRVVDAATGTRLYPTDDQSIGSRTPGRLLAVELPPIATGTGANIDAIRRALADEVGLKVAQLFYDWKTPAPGETIENKRREHAK